MNSPLRSLCILAVAASLPIAVSAQSNTGASTGASGMGNAGNTGTNSGATSGVYNPSGTNTNPNNNGSNYGNSSNRTSTTNSGMTTMPNDTSTTLGIQTITQKALKQQLTASSLTGKEVYDNKGKRVGKVKDVALDYATAPQLASALTSQGGNNNGSSSAMTSHNGNMNTGTNTTTDMAVNSGSTNAGIAATLYGAAAVISPSGSLSQGHKLITVPLAQLNYDAKKHHLTLNLSQKDLANLTKQNSTSRNAAE